jgi:hypothetical protein
MKFLVALLLLPLGAQAQVVSDPNIPGSFGVPESGNYSATVALSVADTPGTTATQAALSVAGSFRIHSGSGRGGGYITVRTLNNPANVTLSLVQGGSLVPAVDSNGVPVTFTVTQVTRHIGAYFSTYNVFTANASVPVGSYVLAVDGTETCARTGPLPVCSEAQSFFVGATTTFTQLPLTYWWTNSVDPSLQLLGIEPLSTVVQTYSDDPTGPQQICDLYDYPITIAVQTFYDSTAPGQFQVDMVSSSADNSSGQWVCTYHILYQNVVNNPGVDVSVDSPSGWVTVASGATPPPAACGTPTTPPCDD